MNTQHTPGPWRATRSRHHANAITEWWIDSPSRKAMACLQVWDLNRNPKWRKEHRKKVREHKKTVREVDANAKLIAAAPELLDFALLYESGRGTPKMLNDMARAAIAKAKGVNR